MVLIRRTHRFSNLENSLNSYSVADKSTNWTVVFSVLSTPRKFHAGKMIIVRKNKHVQNTGVRVVCQKQRTETSLQWRIRKRLQ